MKDGTGVAEREDCPGHGRLQRLPGNYGREHECCEINDEWFKGGSGCERERGKMDRRYQLYW